MRADWTACGACTSGSIAPPRDATRPRRGGAAMTSTRADKRRSTMRTHIVSRDIWLKSRRTAGAGRDNAAVRGVADWLSLAAAPTFAMMALLTGVLGGGA